MINRTLIQFKTNRQTSSLFDNYPTLSFSVPIRSISKSIKQRKIKKKSAGPFRETAFRKNSVHVYSPPRVKEKPERRFPVGKNRSSPPPPSISIPLRVFAHFTSWREIWNSMAFPYRTLVAFYPIYRRERMEKGKKKREGSKEPYLSISLAIGEGVEGRRINWFK